MTTKLKQHYANIYERYKCQLKDITQKDIKELHNIIEDRFNKLPCGVFFIDKDIDSYEEVKSFFEKENVLYISNRNNDSALLPGDLNLKFRVWHDYLHMVNEYPFNYTGEYKTYLAHISGINKEVVKKLLFSEIVFQTSYYEVYGVFPKKQKVIINF